MMTLATLASAQPLSAIALLTLVAALGLSATSGLRAYLPLLATGIAANVPGVTTGSLVPLRPGFDALSSVPVLAVLGILTIGEFSIDKIPVVDHISDAVHTIIRPLAGAAIMAGTANTLSDLTPWGAAAAGAILALAFHGVKATARPVVTASTAGVGNPVVSFIEDVLVIVAVLALVLAPIIGLALVVLLTLFFGRLVRKAFRRMRGAQQKQGKVQVAAASPPARQHRGRRGVAPIPAAAQPNALAAANPAPVPVGVPVAPVRAQMGQMAGAAPVPGTPGMPATPPAAAPTGPVSSNSPTVPATQQAPYYAPPQQSDPIQRIPGHVIPPTPTQPYPGAAYPSDAPTLPGSYQRTNP